ncbi:hypothetical protein KSP40_PGU008143 [Platanthera guangdongensis]|uniref:Uncharacterized protein n=1 Tax=Platanthera guangdongensis TaxID=2320717 RepID=A0ABR2MQD8_9ASPA
MAELLLDYAGPRSTRLSVMADAFERRNVASDFPNHLLTELALNLCWAIWEHGGGGASHNDVAQELFESLELLLYENLSSSRLGFGQESGVESNGVNSIRSSQVRLLCFVITAIAKLATSHTKLLPRARVALAKGCFVCSACGLPQYVPHSARGYGCVLSPSVVDSAPAHFLPCIDSVRGFRLPLLAATAL